MSYRVVYTQDPSGWWLAEIPSVQGCRTQGRTLAQAKTRIRGALSACFEDARATSGAVFIHDVRLPPDAAASVACAQEAKAAATRAAEAAQRAESACVTKLARILSRREIAAIVGGSHQRVQQIANPKQR